MIISEFHFWSPILGSDAVRISTADSLGREYFAIVPRESSRQWREAKARALTALQSALDAELYGEVKINL